MSNSHTPGPWHSEYTRIRGWDGDELVVIAEWLSDNPYDLRAIKALPELLEVVRSMANFDGRNNNSHLKEMAKEALEKATILK